MQTPNHQSPNVSPNEAGRLPANAPDSAPLAAGAAPQQKAPANGCELIAAERRRQMEVEGWTPEHDDTHAHRELARAALAYLEHYAACQWIINDDLGFGFTDGLERYQSDPPPDSWPKEWAEEWWKPKNKVLDLVRVGALIAAEIDRLHRAAQAACDVPPSGPQNLQPPAANEGRLTDRTLTADSTNTVP